MHSCIFNYSSFIPNSIIEIVKIDLGGIGLHLAVMNMNFDSARILAEIDFSVIGEMVT
jgi:hypothetical protein